MKRIRIGTRASKLALVQANAIKSAIERKHAGISVEIIKIKTTGDKILDVPLAKIGGKGLFVKEIEEMLLRRDVDIAVHSMKDVPVEIPEGLGIVVTTKREDPRDVLISSDGRRLYELNNALIGTSSLRRQVQLKNILRSPIIENLRGNLDTRIRKLKEGRYDAVIVAMAGLRRMGLQAEVTEVIPTDVMLPAVGQGCLGIEAHMDNMEVRD
ncbi:MAG TPA: hydroxymethylbilane synthase, partial [bacterium]